MHSSTDSTTAGGTTLSSHDSGYDEFLVGSSAPHQSATPCTPAPTATSPGMSTPALAHVEPSPVEFATPLSHDEERIDACYDGEPLRYRTMEDLLGDQPVPGLVPRPGGTVAPCVRRRRASVFRRG
jgi:hypothetical protein